MIRLRLRSALAPVLVLPLAVAATGCVTGGERANTGDCPAGEVCSSKTPDGLLFRGPRFADDFLAIDQSVKTTARGGAQTLSVLEGGYGTPLALPFDASIDSGPMEVTGQIGNAVVLAADGQGSATLRITDPDDGTLFDRVAVGAEAIASTSVIAYHQELFLPDDPAPALLAGAPAQLLIRLRDAGGQRLVDQSLTLDVTGATAQRASWDTVDVTAGAPGTLDFALTAGDVAGVQGGIAVVDSIDRVIPGWTSFDATNPPFATDTLVACVEGWSGDAPVVGLAWTFTADGADQTSAWLTPNCIAFERDTAGTVTIHGEAGGVGTDLAIDVGPAPAQGSARRALVHPAPDHTPGERAAALD
jgi:hypothetical protein